MLLIKRHEAYPRMDNRKNRGGEVFKNITKKPRFLKTKTIRKHGKTLKKSVNI